MDAKDAVARYQYAERSKAELMAASLVAATLVDYKGEERKGAKRMLIQFLELFRSDLLHASTATGSSAFRSAAGKVSEAISAIESDDPETAGIRLGEAVSATTTPAQESWAYLLDNGFI